MESHIVEQLAVCGVGLHRLHLPAACCAAGLIALHPGLQELVVDDVPSSLDLLKGLRELQVLKLGSPDMIMSPWDCTIEGGVLQQVVGACSRLRVLQLPMIVGQGVLFHLNSLVDLEINMLPLALLPELLESQMPALQRLALLLVASDWDTYPEGFPPVLDTLWAACLQHLVGAGRADVHYLHTNRGRLEVDTMCGSLGALTVLHGTALGSFLSELRIYGSEMTSDDVRMLAFAVGAAVERVHFESYTPLVKDVLVTAVEYLPRLMVLAISLPYSYDIDNDIETSPIPGLHELVESAVAAAKSAACSVAREGRPLEIIARGGYWWTEKSVALLQRQCETALIGLEGVRFTVKR